MFVKTLVRTWWAAALLLAAAPAQQLLGGRPRTPTWEKWLQGDKVVFGGDAAPVCTLVAFYTRAPHASVFAADGDCLADLQRRFQDKGLVVVAVTADEKQAALSAWPGCRVVFDDEGATTTEWFGDAEPVGNVLLLDKSGTVVFSGRPESGLVDAVDAAVEGRKQLKHEAEAENTRLNMLVSFDDIPEAEALRSLERLVAHAPRDGVGLGLLYLAHVMKRNDAATAVKMLPKAVASLATERRPLAAFTSLVLRGDPRRPELVTALRAPLQAAAAGAPNDVAVQLAYLRVLVAAGDAREAGRHSMKIRKAATTTADDCLEFASILTGGPDPAPHRDSATIAVDKAEQLGADGRFVTAARYGIAARCAADEAEQKRLLDAYFKDNQKVSDDPSSINNDCWYLMTELATMGRYDAFAAGLAGRMLEHKDRMTYYMYDTVALAMFVAGRVNEAVELQQIAIDQGGKDNPEYTGRLDRYKAALTPVTRPAPR